MSQKKQPRQTTEAFNDWRKAIDDRMYEVFGITICDAGIDDQRLTNHFKSNETPNDFVDWFGEKYDLDRKTDYLLSPKIAS
jgi:hypothetical protein